MILRGPHRPDLLKNETLPDILEATAIRMPDKTALIFGERSLSYAELNDAADKVAGKLIALGVKPGQVVGLWLPRGPELLIAQAGISKAGAAWLPFDADTPMARIEVCLEDANSPGLLTNRSHTECTRPLWVLEDLLASPDTPLLRRDKDFTPDCPAYVIYTSGSTGKPKGIAVNHRSISHFLRSENEVLCIRAEDRVYQGFSVAFDMSFEEIWIAYLAGATLWLAPKEITGDPDALPQILEDNKISVLHAVPTLLSLFPREVPGLRLINLGGEMCPQALVERWATPELQLFNTYGPTEATVSASLAELHRGVPVTIGKPLANYGLLIVDEQLNLLPAGETGELCIIGPGVAQGYLGRPDLTAEKFIVNPYAEGEHESRLYRTGDLARIDDTGNIQCLGRVDDQIKIRGFRVELGEIEAILSKEQGIGTAAVVVKLIDEVEQLVAYFVPAMESTPHSSVLRRHLAAQLPPYMLPARFEAVPVLPRLTSGKIDRKALRALPLNDTAGDNMDEESDTPQGPAEIAIFSLLKQLFPGQPLRRDADFFTDLGGHSLLAARLVSKLREDSRFANVTVHDIYCERRIAAIASALSKKQISGAASEPEIVQTPRLRRILCSLAQAATLPPLVCLKMTQWLSPFFTYHYFTGDEGDSMTRAILAALLVYLLANFGSFLFVIAAKWLVVGKLKAGRYPLWGLMYFRWWLADRISEIPPRHLLSGSSLNALYLRALGAKIGQDVLIGALFIRAPDLLCIGNGVSIGSAVNLENARVERGELILGKISIGNEAIVDSYAVMEGDTAIGDYGHLGGLSSLATGQKIPAVQRWEGSPSHFAAHVDLSRRRPRVHISALRTAWETLFYILGANLVAIVFFLPVFPSFILIDYLDARWLKDIDAHHAPLSAFFTYLLLSIPASAVLVLATVLASTGFRWMVLPRLKSGTWSVHSAVYFSKWLGNQIQESSLFVLHGLYATVYAPWWYRLLGARVGPGTEISTALGVVPDMLTIGRDSFVADGVMLGDERIESGWMSLRPTVIGDRTFLGNGAFVPDGSILPDDVLIGVQSSVPENDRIKPGDTWVGNPPIILPAREQFEGFDPKLTFHPSLARRLSRGFVEGLRIVMPMAVVIAVGYLTVELVMPLAGAGRIFDTLLALALSGFLYGIGSFLFVVLIKWLAAGTYKPRSAPMWTAFVWMSEAVTNLYESIAVPNFIDFLRGTPMLPPCLRLLGCKTGKGIYMDTTFITEFDCVSIGDYSALNGGCGPQTHLFEDRIMKIGAVSIGRGVTVGPRTIILYGAHIGDGATLGPLSLILKGENIPAGTCWIGSPAEPWATV